MNGASGAKSATTVLEFSTVRCCKEITSPDIKKTRAGPVSYEFFRWFPGCWWGFVGGCKFVQVVVILLIHGCYGIIWLLGFLRYWVSGWIGLGDGFGPPQLEVGVMAKIVYIYIFYLSRFTILSWFFVMFVLLFCKLFEHYSQTIFPIIKTAF